ncbi:MAG: hypothetical protein ACI8Q1_002279, partial [Parvicella sp.]
MKLFIFRIITTFCLLCLVQFNFSQNVNYNITVTELYADGDNNDGGVGLNDQDPTWFVWAMDNGTTPGSLTAFQATGCISTTNTYGVWWAGNPAHNGPP